MGFARDKLIEYYCRRTDVLQWLDIVMELRGEINISEIGRSYEGSFCEYSKLFSENI